MIDARAAAKASRLLRLARGIDAERLAERHLAAQGLDVIARNFRCRLGELDLVCGDGSVLVFVEVRQRSRGDYGGALGSVTHLKRRRIIRAAQVFLLRSRALRAWPVRFDVVAVQGHPGGAHELQWIKGAFHAD